MSKSQGPLPPPVMPQSNALPPKGIPSEPTMLDKAISTAKGQKDAKQTEAKAHSQKHGLKEY